MPKRKPQPKLEVLRAENLSRLRWLVHGFSTRLGGVSRPYGGHALNLGFTDADTRKAVEQNRARFLRALAGGGRRSGMLVPLRQVHGDTIHLVESPPKQLLVGDGLITRAPGLLLAVQTADCLPVLLVDPKHRAVGIFHAGWRGTLARIVEKGVAAMRLHFGSHPRQLLAAIGPAIHACCYAVGGEVRDRLASQFDYAETLFHKGFESDPVREKYPLLFLTSRAPGHSGFAPKLHLDLVAANRRQLLDAGLSKPNLWASPLCTSCRIDLLFSHRKEKGKTGRLIGAVGIRNL
ncbi:MAG: peptidoglycan editing factor PgeF [Acidobacteria bacterium]|nr:peptidoglycan editing factor PgeF [Acidobacteriota bacterium]